MNSVEQCPSRQSLSPRSKSPLIIGKLVNAKQIEPMENPEMYQSALLSREHNTKLPMQTTYESFHPVTHLSVESSVLQLHLNPHHEPQASNLTEKNNECYLFGSIHRQRSVNTCQDVTKAKAANERELIYLNKINQNVKGIQDTVIKGQTSPLDRALPYRFRGALKIRKYSRTRLGKTPTGNRKCDSAEEQKLLPRISQIRKILNVPELNHTRHFQRQKIFNIGQKKQRHQFIPSPLDHIPIEVLGDYEQDDCLESTYREGHEFIYNRHADKGVDCSFKVDLRTPVSRLKQILVEGDQELHLSFMVPQMFFRPPSRSVAQKELYLLMLQAFHWIDVTPQIVSIKKYLNCVMLREKDRCLLWNFNGKVYFGGWDRQNTLLQGKKHGIALEWVPGKFIYYGEFRDNRKSGYGVMKKANREVYVGCWKNGQMSGWGKLYDSLGQLVRNGEFIEGCFDLQKIRENPAVKQSNI